MIIFGKNTCQAVGRREYIGSTMSSRGRKEYIGFTKPYIASNGGIHDRPGGIYVEAAEPYISSNVVAQSYRCVSGWSSFSQIETPRGSDPPAPPGVDGRIAPSRSRSSIAREGGLISDGLINCFQSIPGGSCTWRRDTGGRDTWRGKGVSGRCTRRSQMANRHGGLPAIREPQVGIFRVGIEELDLFDQWLIFTLPHRVFHEHCSGIYQPIGPQGIASMTALMSEHSLVRCGIDGRAEQGADGAQGIGQGLLPSLRAQPL